MTSAAIVMVAVFAIFATLSYLDFKMMGVGLATAILVDATIVRAVLLPATMKLLGDWNWYLPRWLEWLPSLGHEESARRRRAGHRRRRPGRRDRLADAERRSRAGGRGLRPRAARRGVRLRWRDQRAAAPAPRRPSVGNGAAQCGAFARSGATGDEIDLVALAAATCERYYAEYTDEDAVYGQVGRLWCQHDLQHLLNWAALDVAGAVTLDDPGRLAGPHPRSPASSRSCAWPARWSSAPTSSSPSSAPDAAPMAGVLRGAATMIVERGTFLED